MELFPETALLSVDPCTLPRSANVLAGEATCDEIASGEVVFSDVANISMPGNVGPMFGEYLCRVVIDFYLPFTCHACSL
jgi:hypothetical protein